MEIVKLLAARQGLVKQAARAAMMTRLHDSALRESVSPEVIRNVYDAMIDSFIDLELRECARIRQP